MIVYQGQRIPAKLLMEKINDGYGSYSNAWRLVVVMGIAVILSSHAALVYSSGIASHFHHKDMPYTDIQWPFVTNDAQEYLGLYGGIAAAYNQSGGRESAILLILETGYIVPILGNGDIATFPTAYFSGEHCSGREYLPVTAAFPGLLPMRGLVYRSAVTNTPVYAPKHRESTQTRTASRLVLQQDGSKVCEQFSNHQHVLEVLPNAPEVTGLAHGNHFHLAVVELDRVARRPQQTIASPSMGELQNSGGDPAYPEDTENTQEGCSPGCLASALDNGSCDPECYVEACFFDQGDCDEIDPEELRQMLSEICSPGCFSADIGDDFCDPACNNQACQFDAGDCSQ